MVEDDEGRAVEDFGIKINPMHSNGPDDGRRTETFARRRSQTSSTAGSKVDTAARGGEVELGTIASSKQEAAPYASSSPGAAEAASVAKAASAAKVDSRLRTKSALSMFSDTKAKKDSSFKRLFTSQDVLSEVSPKGSGLRRSLTSVPTYKQEAGMAKGGRLGGLREPHDFGESYGVEGRGGKGSLVQLGAQLEPSG